jgi:hypothetical protein
MKEHCKCCMKVQHQLLLSKCNCRQSDVYENRLFRWIDGCCDTLKQLTLPPTSLVAIEMLELGVLSLNGSIAMAI